MNLRVTLAMLVLCSASGAHAKKPIEPCKTKSRQMTLVKNCYTGEMVKPLDGGGQFFTSVEMKNPNVNFCYNSLVTVDHKAGDALVHIRVLRDGKDGQFHAYHYSMPHDEVKKSKKDVPAVALQGLKGECFASDPDACGAGILKTIGWTDTDVPMVVALGKATAGQITVSHLMQSREEIERTKPRELPAQIETDANRTTQMLLQEIRRKIVSAARVKTNSMRAGVSAKKLADASEQFRYCSMALEGFLKDKKMTDPFSPEEKMTLSSLTNFMNGDANVPQGASAQRLPAAASKAKPAFAPGRR